MGDGRAQRDADERKGDAPPIPYTNEQLLEAISIEDYEETYPKKDLSMEF